jgi:hypothetical protein
MICISREIMAFILMGIAVAWGMAAGIYWERKYKKLKGQSSQGNPIKDCRATGDGPGGFE